MVILSKVHLPWRLLPVTVRRTGVTSSEVQAALGARLPDGYEVSSPSRPCPRCGSTAADADTVNVQTIGLWHGRAHVQIVPKGANTDLEVHPVYSHHVKQAEHLAADGSNEVQSVNAPGPQVVSGSMGPGLDAQRAGPPARAGSDKAEPANLLERSMDILFGSYAVAHKVNNLLRDAPEFHAVDRPYLGEKYEKSELIDLLTVYATQFGSYNTLLWQVPALSLTAQAFLMTIALSPDSNRVARLITSVLSIIIAFASTQLMHDQRGHAINHGEVARRLASQLELANRLDGNFQLNDAKPEKTNGEDVWRAVDHGIYAIWKVCMWLFLIADIVIIVLAVFRSSLLNAPLH